MRISAGLVNWDSTSNSYQAPASDSVYQNGRYESRGGFYEAVLSLGRSYLSIESMSDFL